MERKKFLKSSMLAIGGLSLLPTATKLVTFENLGAIQLIENQHIRHGYYGDECMRNELTSCKLKTVRIDRFLNPEGDMTLVEMNGDYGSIRVFCSEKEILVQVKSEIRQLNNLKSGDLSWMIEKKLAIGKPEALHNQLHDFSEYIILKSSGENCIYSKEIDKIPFLDKGDLLILIV